MSKEAKGEVGVTKKKRGFAAMSPEKQREIASLGGRTAHMKGTAYEFNAESAARAGRLGGEAAQRNRKLAEVGKAPVGEPTDPRQGGLFPESGSTARAIAENVPGE